MRREDEEWDFLVVLDENPGILISASLLWSLLGGALDVLLFLDFLCVMEA